MTTEQLQAEGRREFEDGKLATYTNEYGYVHKIPNHDEIVVFQDSLFL